MSRRAIAALVALAVLASSFHLATAQPTLVKMGMSVYSDGTVVVSQSFLVPKNYTSVNLQLLSTLIANPVVTDENGSSLYFQIAGPNMTVYTVGAAGMSVSYYTGSLTSKQGTIWMLAFQSAFNATVVLPQGSTLTSVSGTPSSITTTGGSPVVTLPAGKWQVQYGVPITVISTRSSQSTTGQASQTTGSTSTSHQSGSSSQVSGATTSGSTTTSTPGNTSTVTGLVGSGNTAPDLSLYAGISVAAVLAVGSLLSVRRRRSPFDPNNTELRPDDIKVIEFINEKGGKVLEPEIRVRFALPKTSAWRQIKRLERLGYVKVVKIGSQNQVELVKSRPTGQA